MSDLRRDISNNSSTEAGADLDYMSDRITKAAYACFDRYGIAKTTIEDIAKSAGVSRPTVYRYFSGKEDILDNISCLEAAKINVEIRNELSRKNLKSFEDIITEALFIIIMLSRDNQYLSGFLSNLAFQAKAAGKTSRFHQISREMWKGLMARAAARGELADDLDLDEILSWLTLGQAMLQVKFSGGDIDRTELRRFIRRFVVRPLMNQPSDRG